ncbi:MAG: Lrp/AsnC family transcriptional regulator [Thermodesulfobacteriota bacterium]|nr:Lrp/AsnC family transcriptional regulator [Thermodesulfobacteriota bacterium]
MFRFISMDDKDRAILKLAQGDLPVKQRPFDKWARSTGIRESEVVERLVDLKKKGIIRRFKAILRHYQAGVKANAMVTWAVPKDRIEEVGGILASMGSITHCYERSGFSEYNLFTMIHGTTKKKVTALIEEIAVSINIKRYKVFWSKKELKKSSMEYF